MDSAPVPARLRWAGLGVALVLGLLVRLGAGTQTSGCTWDSFFYLTQAAQLEGLFDGELASQYGATHPTCPAIGWALTIRAAHELTGLTLIDAAQLLALVSGELLIALAFIAARRLAGDAAGVAAAMLAALNGTLVHHSVTADSEHTFAALGLGALLLLARSPQTTGSAAGAALLAGLSNLLRPAGVASCAVLLAYLVWRVRRGEASRRQAALWTGLTVSLFLLSWGINREIEARNHAPHQAQLVVNHTLHLQGHFPDAYDVDASGRTLRLASDSHTPWERGGWSLQLRLWTDGVLALVETSGGWILAAVLGVALLVGRRGTAAFHLACGLAPPALAIVASAPATAMLRYATPGRTLLLVLAAAGGVALAERHARGRVSAAAVFLSAGLGALAIGAALSPPTALLRVAQLRDPRSVRVGVRTIAAELRSSLPPGVRVARGPGGSTEALALAGLLPVYLAAGPSPAHVTHFVRSNDLRWIVLDPREAHLLVPLLPDAELRPRLTYTVGGRPQLLVDVVFRLSR